MATFEKALDVAVGLSCLSRLSPSARQYVLGSAMRAELPAGARFIDEDGVPRVGLLVVGVMRGYRTMPDGRQLTLFYDHAGCLPGIIVAFGQTAPGAVTAITPATVMVFPTGSVRHLLRTDGQAALVFAEEFSFRVGRAIEEVTGHLAGSLRERIGHHLLALATGHHEHGPAKRDIRLTQQDLAEATGTARESVSRSLAQLEAEGIIKVRPRHITILDFDALCPTPKRTYALTG